MINIRYQMGTNPGIGLYPTFPKVGLRSTRCAVEGVIPNAVDIIDLASSLYSQPNQWYALNVSVCLGGGGGGQ